MTPLGDGTTLDPTDPNLVHGDLAGFELLGPFNQAGVLAAADVHTAMRLCRLAGVEDEEVALAVALAVRVPRVGHVSVNLRDVQGSAAEAGDEVDLEALPWPGPEEWVLRLQGSRLIDAGSSDAASDRPLKLVGTALYLERYWRDEVTVAREILGRLGAGEGSAEEAEGLPIPDALARLFPGHDSRDQLRAARLVLSRRFSVIAGGPGTGKTTTVARLLAGLFEQAVGGGRRIPLVALAAPTGKAAARMEDAVRAEGIRIETGPQVRAALEEISGSTLHRLLGTRFDRPGRFRHHPGHRLPHDIVVVDEASMVSLSLMASLVGAVRPDARLVLVGDPDQLVSVEAGAVLADIVGPARRLTPAGGVEAPGPARGLGRPVAAGREEVPGRAAGAVPAIADAICVLRHNHRFAGSLAELSAAVQAGDEGSALGLLARGDPSLVWVASDPGELLLGASEPSRSTPLDSVKRLTIEWASDVLRLAGAGDSAGALAGLRRHRVLCAHRRGAAGVQAWNRLVRDWVAGESQAGPTVEGDVWYPGRPVMVTANDYGLRLFNGDSGVTVALPAGSAAGEGTARWSGRLAVAFDEGGERAARMVSPTRLNAVETVYAMTVHKSQGSEFDRVTILLPPAGSRLLTRELLYTALTRARLGVTVVGTAEALGTAVRTPIARASGLGERLWGDAPL